jgi:uncharacterized protein (TIGR03000 family)
MKRFVCLAAFGLVALVVAMPARANAGSFGIGGIGRIGAISLGGYTGWSPRFWNRGWGRYRVYDRGWYPVYYYPAPSYIDTYQVYYPPAETADANSATLRMRVPSDARVWVEGDATSSSGPDRTFVSPALTPGFDYRYHVRVQWNENGKAMERNRDFTVHAGDRINVSFDK